MVYAALSNALTALDSYRKSISVASNNIANTHSEGYTRKVAGRESIVLDGRGSGVRINAIRREVDEYLMRARRESLSDQSRLQALQEHHARIIDRFGSPDSNNAIPMMLTKLEKAFEDLEISPESAAARRETVRLAGHILDRIRSDYFTYQDLRARADERIGEVVGDINSLLENIDDLNIEIVRSDALGRSDGSLRDKRDVALNKLAQFIDISYFEQSNGDVVISTRSGHILLDVDPSRLHHAAAQALDDSIQYDPDRVPPPGDQGAIGAIYVGQRRDPRDDITRGIRGGELAGLIEARDRLLPQLTEAVNELTIRMRDVVNAAHNRSSAVPPPDDLTGTHRFLNPVDGQFFANAAQITLAAGGVLRLTEIQKGPGPQTGEAQSVALIDLDQLRADSGGDLDLQELINKINAISPNLRAIYDPGSGRFSIRSTTPERTGVMIDSPSSAFILQGQAPAAPGNPSALPTALAAPGGGSRSFTIRDSDGIVLARINLEDGSTTARVLASDGREINQVHNLANAGQISSIEEMARILNAIDDITAVVTREGPAAVNTARQRLFVMHRDDRMLDLSDFDPPGAANDFVAASEGLISMARTDRFPSWRAPMGAIRNLPLARFDKTRTGPDSLGLEIDVANGARFNISFDPHTESLDVLAQRIDALAGISARLVNQDGWRIEILADDNSALTFGGTGAAYMGLGDKSHSSFEHRSLSHYFGLNDFFVDPRARFAPAQNLQVAESLREDPNLIATARSVNGFVIGDHAVNSGDNRGARSLAEAFRQRANFRAAGGMPAIHETFAGYARRILSDQATRSDLNKDEIGVQEEIINELEHRIESVSGVNMDEELTNLIELQKAFTASARVMSVSQEILDELVNIVS